MKNCFLIAQELAVSKRRSKEMDALQVSETWRGLLGVFSEGAAQTRN